MVRASSLSLRRARLCLWLRAAARGLRTPAPAAGRLRAAQPQRGDPAALTRAPPAPSDLMIKRGRAHAQRVGRLLRRLGGREGLYQVIDDAAIVRCLLGDVVLRLGYAVHNVLPNPALWRVRVGRSGPSGGRAPRRQKPPTDVNSRSFKILAIANRPARFARGPGDSPRRL